MDGFRIGDFTVSRTEPDYLRNGKICGHLQKLEPPDE